MPKNKKLLLAILAIFMLAIVTMFLLKPQNLLGGKSFTLRVVDQNDTPVPEVTLKITTTYGTTPSLKEIQKESVKYTDANGELYMTVLFPVSIDLEKKGYLPAYEDLRISDNTKIEDVHYITSDVETIVMTKAPPPVRIMKSPRLIGRFFRDETKTLGFGIKFTDFYATRTDPKTTDDKEIADIWVEAKSIGGRIFKAASPQAKTVHNMKQWEVIFDGLNKWVFKVPENKDPYAPHIEAPTKGYSYSLKFRGDEVPKILFIKEKDKERYGKLTYVQFRDSQSKAEEFKLEIYFEYEVQSEAQGSTSLYEEEPTLESIGITP